MNAPLVELPHVFTLSVSTPVSGSLTGAFAKTVKTSAVPPLEIQILFPFRIYLRGVKCHFKLIKLGAGVSMTYDFPSGDKTALDLMDPASDPLVGSVKANAANFSPEAKVGRYFFFCSSVPDQSEQSMYSLRAFSSWATSKVRSTCLRTQTAHWFWASSTWSSILPAIRIPLNPMD